MHLPLLCRLFMICKYLICVYILFFFHLIFLKLIRHHKNSSHRSFVHLPGPCVGKLALSHALPTYILYKLCSTVLLSVSCHSITVSLYHFPEISVTVCFTVHTTHQYFLHACRVTEWYWFLIRPPDVAQCFYTF